MFEAASAIGTSSIKDTKPATTGTTTNEGSNQLPSSQPLSIATTTTELADTSSTSTNTPLPIPTNADKGNINKSNNQVSVPSASVRRVSNTTNNVLGLTNTNVGKLILQLINSCTVLFNLTNIFIQYAHENVLLFYLALPADSVSDTKIAQSSVDRRSSSTKNSSGNIVLSKGISTPAEKKLKESLAQSTNISFIATEGGNFCASKKPGDTGGFNDNIILSKPTNPSSLLSNQPLILPHTQSAATAGATMDTSVQQSMNRRRSSNHSNTSTEMPKLSMIGALGHPGRLGGPSHGMPLRGTGPIHWHGMGGPKM